MPIVFADCEFRYRRGRPLLEGLTLSFSRGRTVLLGPNGAGKSTLLGLAASVLLPRAGTVELGRLCTARRKDLSGYRRRVGWLPQQVAAVPGLRAREQVAYAGWLKGLSRADAWERADTALARVGLQTLAAHKSSRLSGGQLRRVGIAQCLVHDAEVLLMDEPTAGLDPVQRQVFRDLLADLDDRVDVIVSTHQTEDIDASYEHVVVLDDGRPRFQGSVGDFLALSPDTVPSQRRAEAAYASTIRQEV
ncbi:ATP-binding cassette domain-containing protein [Streptomyces sp. SID3343]|nr:ATP-binding cassette domain-containing protein [Streptomyces sp. SID3343]